MKKILTAVTLLSLSFSGFAKNENPHFIAIPLVKTNYKWLDKSTLAKEISEAKERHGRSTSTLGALSAPDDLDTFIEKFLQLKNADQIDNAILELDKNYDLQSNALKLVTIQLVPMLKMKGIVYRLLPIAKEERITESMLLTGVRGIANSIKVYIPEDHMGALFDYFVDPYHVKGKTVVQYSEAWQFQNFLAAELYPELLRSVSRLKALKLGDSRVVWDNRLLSGSTTFRGGIQRHMTISETERQSSLANAHAGLAALCVFNAYSVEGLLSYSRHLGNLHGLDGFLFTQTDGVTSYERNTKVIQKPEFANLYVLKNSGEKWTRRAFQHIKDAVGHTNIAVEEVRDLPADAQAVINPGIITPWMNRLDRYLERYSAMVDGPFEIYNNFNGNVVTINLPEFYNNPPHDLKAFRPYAWDLKSKFLMKAGVKTINFNYGRPVAWHAEVYRPYVSSIKDDTDVPRILRAFSQSWSDPGYAFPIFTFSR